MVLAGIGAAVGGAAALYNAWQQYQQNKWQKQAQKITWKREDTAQQRAVADLKAAGLSPTLAAGHPAPVSAPSRIEAPQADAMIALNLQQMKANVAKTSAEARTQEVLAGVNEASRHYLELMNTEKYYQLMNTRALTGQRVLTEQAQTSYTLKRLEALKHDLERSKKFGIRTGDRSQWFTGMQMGDQLINESLNIMDKSKGKE